MLRSQCLGPYKPTVLAARAEGLVWGERFKRGFVGLRVRASESWASGCVSVVFLFLSASAC